MTEPKIPEDRPVNWIMRQQLEQATGAIREAGVVLWAYYDGLIKACFEDAAALHLTADYARTLFTPNITTPDA